MAKQFSTTLRNAVADQFETTIGTAPILEIRTGAQPADCAAADSGSLLCTINLPSDWLTNASAGAKALAGTWQANAGASGTAGHYRIKNTAGSVCHEQGSVTNTSGGGDLELQNVSINSGQQVTITAYALSVNGA